MLQLCCPFLLNLQTMLKLKGRFCILHISTTWFDYKAENFQTAYDVLLCANNLAKVVKILVGIFMLCEFHLSQWFLKRKL